ncbi:hypothetical protein M5X17_31295 [Paenibacillus alvei]|uniref:hypothetical protein n=1 Tax=Paenibacillus alvei TaxID=44250 RepID=UPI0022809416|nr:hypothetical protein [Paenibacillus alvei]MCY9738180.1 hypothetical protein [Paenibacillus alvei]
MYLVITEYEYETAVAEIQKKKQVKEYIEERKKDAVGFDIYKVTKKLSVDDFQD